jgi:uncharacterized protein YeaO (DUF488 family)
MLIRLKSVYDKPEVGDGWRKWFGHSTIRWQEFRLRYLEELEASRKTWTLLARP